MVDAIREAGIGRLPAEMEIGLAGMPDRPFADLLVEIEKAGLVGHFRARLGRDEPARRCWRDRRLLVARPLANEAAWSDRPHLGLGRAGAWTVGLLAFGLQLWTRRGWAQAITTAMLPFVVVYGAWALKIVVAG